MKLKWGNYIITFVYFHGQSHAFPQKKQYLCMVKQ